MRGARLRDGGVRPDPEVEAARREFWTRRLGRAVDPVLDGMRPAVRPAAE
ncbi:hypothetical protein ACFWIA_05200 [Streptomyces sp. NPDC127068]